MADFAVYYRYANEGKMQMRPIEAETPEEAETKFLEKEKWADYIQYWVCTEHISSSTKRH